ncbi:MAG: hypothetical protein AAF810_09520 [Cyanobacteria bacterium P01_D01_bin.36]
MFNKRHQLFLGMVALSGSVHVLASAAPWPQPTVQSPTDVQASENPTSTEQDEAAIALTQLPARTLTPPSNKPVSSTAPAEQAINLAPLPSASVQLPQEDEFVEDLPELSEPETEDIASEDLSTSEAAYTEAPSTEDEQTSETEQKPEVVSGPEIEQGILLKLAADFPHLAGSQAGCHGLDSCHQISGGGRLTQVTEKLVDQMRAVGYQLTEDVTVGGAGHQVYEVVMPNDPEIYYLNVFSDGLDVVVYTITLNVLSLDELKNLRP